MLFLPLLDILTCNFVSKQSFQNVTKSLFAHSQHRCKKCSDNVTAIFTSTDHWAERLFVGFWKDALLAELQA